MTIVSITANNTRVEDSESGTGWSNIGGGSGGASENAFPYQGGNIYNRKITGTQGFYYTPTSDGGSSQNMTTAAKSTWIVKAIVTDKNGLNATDGLKIRLGSGTNAYYEYVIAGTGCPVDTLKVYPPKTSIIIVAIDPSIAVFRNATSGSPNLSAANYFGLQCNFDSSTAKSENVGLDAIDLGTGLTLTGGGGADPVGTLKDFSDFDEGITNNRFGYATQDAVPVFNGMLTIGSATIDTEFEDYGSLGNHADNLAAPGYGGITIDLNRSGGDFLDYSQTTGLGNKATSDTRPDFIINGSLRNYTFGGSRKVYRNIEVNSTTTTFDGATLECSDLHQGGATITGCTLLFDSASGIAACDDFDGALFTNSTIRQGGTGHAIEFTTTGDKYLTGLVFDGFGVDGTTSAAVVNSSGGVVNLNVPAGETPPTFTNVGGGSVTNIVTPPTILTVIGIPAGLEGRIRQGSATLAYQAGITDGSFSYSYQATNLPALITIGGVSNGGVSYERREIQVVLSSENQIFQFETALNPSYIG